MPLPIFFFLSPILIKKKRSHQNINNTQYGLDSICFYSVWIVPLYVIIILMIFSIIFHSKFTSHSKNKRNPIRFTSFFIPSERLCSKIQFVRGVFFCPFGLCGHNHSVHNSVLYLFTLSECLRLGTEIFIIHVNLLPKIGLFFFVYGLSYVFLVIFFCLFSPITDDDDSGRDRQYLWKIKGLSDKNAPRPIISFDQWNEHFCIKYTHTHAHIVIWDLHIIGFDSDCFVSVFVFFFVLFCSEIIAKLKYSNFAEYCIE